MAVTIDGSGPLAGVTSINSTVSDTELGYLDGVSSALQTQINAKVSSKILQVVSATSTTSTAVTSATYSDSGLSASITPSSTSSKILVLVSQSYNLYRASGTSIGGTIRLNRGTTAIFGGVLAYESQMVVGGSAGNTLESRWPLIFVDSPSTTSATTYKTQIATDGGVATITAQYGSTESSIVLLEVAA